jgi:hypothetical protein
MGQVIDDLMRTDKNARNSFERRWYDNNFFDDGFHFRMMARQSNKVVDLTDRASLYNPMRAIPKASRQLRGVANLLVAPDYLPVVYPRKVDKTQFQQFNPQTMQMELNLAYEQALQKSKFDAQHIGYWLSEEMKEMDLDEKLAFMVVLAGKHSVSYLQVWPDSAREKSCAQVRDAFDIYLNGSLTDLYDNTHIIVGAPKYISEIKANPDFDPAQLERISPDNRHASSEIKEAYMKTRHGSDTNSDSAASVILKEAYIKEYLNEDNVKRIGMQKNGHDILKDKKDGDCVIRQTFVAGDIWLRDEYLSIPDFPFVDFRMEPGPIYQVPLIERFIPTNKSLDLIASRIERYTHTMVTGSWSKRQGEQVNIDNSAGGQILEYTTTPPIQNQIASIPGFVFNYMSFLNQVIEEQGVSTSTLGRIPAGVKAASAIENLKESEYATLKIASTRLKKTVKRVAEKLLDIADNNYVTPQTVNRMENGNPAYFDVIGASAKDKRKAVNLDAVDSETVEIYKDYKVDIEVESGMGYTQEGKRKAAEAIIDKMTILATQGFVPPEAVKVVVQKFLEDYQFGATQDVMEAMQDTPMTDQQAQSVKVAVMEVMADLQKQGIFPTPDQRIKEGQIATAQALKDTGVAGKPTPQFTPKSPTESINYKDVPDSIKRQLEGQAGLTPAYGEQTPVQQDQTIKAVGLAHQVNQSNNPNNQVNQPQKGGKNATNR